MLYEAHKTKSPALPLLNRLETSRRFRSAARWWILLPISLEVQSIRSWRFVWAENFLWYQFFWAEYHEVRVFGAFFRRLITNKYMIKYIKTPTANRMPQTSNHIASGFSHAAWWYFPNITEQNISIPIPRRSAAACCEHCGGIFCWGSALRKPASHPSASLLMYSCIQTIARCGLVYTRRDFLWTINSIPLKSVIEKSCFAWPVLLWVVRVNSQPLILARYSSASQHQSHRRYPSPLVVFFWISMWKSNPHELKMVF